MRTTAEMRRETMTPIPVNKNSLYKPIQRKERVFGPPIISKKIEEALPFKSKPKLIQPTNPKSYVARRAVIVEPEERKKRALIQMLHTIKNNKEMKRHEIKVLKSQQRKKTIEKLNEKFQPLKQEEKKRKFREIGKENARRENKSRRMD
jgi:ribosome biogenesis protein BMS1